MGYEGLLLRRLAAKESQAGLEAVCEVRSLLRRLVAKGLVSKEAEVTCSGCGCKPPQYLLK